MLRLERCDGSRYSMLVARGGSACAWAGGPHALGARPACALGAPTSAAGAPGTTLRRMRCVLGPCAGWATTHVLGQPHTPVQNPGSPGRNLSLRLHAKQSPTLCMPTLYCLSTVAPVLSVPSMLHILMVPSSDPDAYESYVGANRTACTGPWWPLLTSSSCPVS